MSPVLLYPDNSDRINFGCRATSLALRELLQANYSDVAAFHSGGGRAFPSGSYSDVTPIRRSRGAALVRYGGGEAAKSFRRLGWLDDSPEKTLRALDYSRRFLPAMGSLLDAIASSDAFYINGEGSVIFTTPVRRELSMKLALALFASRNGVPVHFVNTVVSPCPTHGENARTIADCMSVFELCTSVLVREPRSFEYLKNLDGSLTNARMVPDALFGWADKPSLSRSWASDELGFAVPFGSEARLLGPGWDAERPYVCVSGASLPPGISLEHRRQVLTEIVQRLVKEHVQVVVVVPDNVDRYLVGVADSAGVAAVLPETNILAAGRVLAGSSAYVSGRYHPSILASIGGSSLIQFESNSHKNAGLRSLLQAPDESLEDLRFTDPDVVETTIDRVFGAIKSSQRGELRTTSRRLGKSVEEAYQMVAGVASVPSSPASLS